MMKKALHNLVFLIYPVIDFIILAFAILFSYKLYWLMGIGKHVYYQIAQIVPMSLIFALFTVFVMQIFGVYKNESSLLNMEQIKNVIKGISLSFLLLGVILVFGQINVSRYVLLLSYIFSLTFVVAEKMVFYHISPFTKLLKGFHKKVLIYGAGEIGRVLFREIANSPKLRIDPIGFIDDDPNKSNYACYQSGFNSSDCIRVLGTREDIKHLKKVYDVDEVYVAISNINNEKLIEILDYLKERNIKASFVPNLYKVFVHNVRINKIGEIPVVIEEEEIEPVYLRFKKYLDLLLASALLILLLPVFLIVSIALKMESKGSAIFALKMESKGSAIFIHDRVGKGGSIFKLYKFRTMYNDTNPYAVNPIDQDDPRITRVGRFLRKTSLDEIPQIFNILKGEMSFVGPRPEMPFIVEQYDEIHKERLKVIPGITGLWQLSGDRKKAIHENMDYDLYYKRHVSFFLDLAILIETLIFAFRGI
jgi:lipopolysaccharide/colanic/teichoic acid biosynthesis glycosyltransferase